MTPERQNEIWAMLPQSERKEIVAAYRRNSTAANVNYAKGYMLAYEDIFGSHNLTAQAEEKPKEPSNHIPDSTKMVDYAQYRLDLAKEIAVAMINEDWASISVTATAIDAVDMANEIVKRLKETEE